MGKKHEFIERMKANVMAFGSALKAFPQVYAQKKARESEDPMERKNYDEQLLNAGSTMSVVNHLMAENIPFKMIHDSVAVAPFIYVRVGRRPTKVYFQYAA